MENVLPGWRNKFLLSIFIGLLVFVGLTLYADLDKILEAGRFFNWRVLPLLLLLAFLNYLLRYVRWEFYLAQVGIRLGKGESFWVFMSGLTMSVTPGKAGELLKAFLIKEINGTPVSYSAPVVVAERLTDLLAIIVLSAYGVVFFNYGWQVLGFTVLFLLFLLLIANPYFSKVLINKLARLSLLVRLTEEVKRAYESTFKLMSLRSLAFAVILSIVAWFCEAYAFYLVLATLDMPASLFQATFIYAFSTLVGAVTMLPGGLGTTEGTMAGLLLLLGLPESSAVLSIFIIRFCTLWFAVVVGFCSLVLGRKKVLGKVGKTRYGEVR